MEFAELARSAGNFKVGIMVETPSIVYQIPALQGKLDFISVGTNDLSQYLFAADRMNPALGAMLNPWQPGLIGALKQISDACAAAGIYSGVCGESASDPAFAVLLAGMGFDSVSSSRSQVGAVRQALSAVSKEQAKEVLTAALTGSNAEEAKSNALGVLSAISEN